MSSKNTENLNLHAWERTDVFSMDEFNENFDAIDKAVAAKAEQTALDAETAARTALAGKVDKKAEQSALNTLSGKVDKKAEQTALDALAGRVRALETGKLVWKFGTYTGTGEVSKTNQRRLEFDFKPLVVIVKDSADKYYGGFPWLYGAAYGHSELNFNGGLYINLTWEDRAVQFYSSLTNSTASEHLDIKNREYIYFALGIEE